MKTAKDLIGLMSPKTLASLIADVQMLGKGAERDDLEIEWVATETLKTAVGDMEAKAMIADACNEECEDQRTPADEGIAAAMQYANQDIDREQARLCEANRAANGWPVAGWRAEPRDLPGNGDDGESHRGHEAGV